MLTWSDAKMLQPPSYSHDNQPATPVPGTSTTAESEDIQESTLQYYRENMETVSNLTDLSN